MAAAAVETSRARGETLRGRLSWPPAAAWALGFAPVAYLALERGGYDPVVRGQVGVALWWIVLLGAVVGALPATRVGRNGWIGLALLAAFGAWTALSLGWTESDHRTADELGKVSTYTALLALTVGVVGRAPARHVLNGLACGIATVAALAVLSRLQPGWFPEDDLPRFFGENAARRLSYPLNYWNGLAVFVAMGLPLVLRAAADARTLLMRAAAAAVVPVMALCVFLTVSRGGALYVAVALIAWMALTPDRAAKLATLAVAAAGSAIVVMGADDRDALQTGLPSAAAAAQGDNLLAMLIVVCVGTALLQIAVSLVTRHVARPSWTVVPRSRAPVVAGIVAVLAVGASLAAGLPGTAEREWQHFKELNPAPQIEGGEDAFARLGSASGNGRYQYWEEAARAQSGAPLRGIGSGTFEFWWARNATHSGGFVRDAHSLYLETLAELGLVGLLLIGAFLAFPLGAGLIRSLSRLPLEHRSAMAAASAGLAAFAVAAAVEWVWDLPAVAAVAVVIVGVLLAAGRRSRPYRGGPPVVLRAAIAGLAVIGLVAVALPLAGADSLRESERRVRAGDLSGALDKARSAADVQPYSATAHLQQALVLERSGRPDAAAVAARRAVAKESTNWRTWLVLSRLEAKAGRSRAAVDAYRRARALNPRSPLFR